MAIDTSKTITGVKYKGTSIPLSGIAIQEKSVFIKDPRGNLIAEYTQDEFLALSDFPTAPTLPGLTFYDYNYSFADAKSYVENYGALDLGAIYEPTSGLSEFDITINDATGLTFTLRMSGTKDWGDGTSSTDESHTYATNGTYTVTCDGSFYASYNYSNNNRLFGGNNTGTAIKEIRLANTITSIPSEYVIGNTKFDTIFIPHTLTSFSNGIFGYCDCLKTLIIPKNVLSIANSAVSTCYSLDYVSFGYGTTSIGISFNFCRSVISITLPPTLTTLDTAFSRCSGLKYIVIPSAVTSIANECFNECYSLEKISLSNGLLTIGNSCFKACYSLQKLTIPQSVTNLGAYAFSSCHNLKTVDIKATNITLNSYLFTGCFSLKEVKFPNTVTWNYNSADYVFRDCYGLESVTLPTSTISPTTPYMFNSCFSLKSLTLPASFKTIGSYICQHCYSLKEFIADGDITSIDGYAFYNTSSCLKYDFSHCTTVPTLLNSYNFYNLNKRAKIIVPDALYNSWIAETNWAAYASYIYKASEV